MERTAEYRMKMSASKMGHPVSDETRKRISESHKAIGSPWLVGKRRSQETKKKIGDGNRHRKNSVAHAHGYVRIYMPGHPRAGKGTPYVLEHILVWEKANGCYLPRGDAIHHLNGIKNDNRIENLARMTHGEHASIHMIEKHQFRNALQARIRQLEEKVRELEGGG
jgi:hypothetical protein